MKMFSLCVHVTTDRQVGRWVKIQRYAWSLSEPGFSKSSLTKTWDEGNLGSIAKFPRRQHDNKNTHSGEKSELDSNPSSLLAAGIWLAEPLTLCEPIPCGVVRIKLSNVYKILGTYVVNVSSVNVLVSVLPPLSFQSKLSYNLVPHVTVIYITIPQQSWRLAGRLWLLRDSYLSIRRRKRSIFWIFSQSRRSLNRRVFVPGDNFTLEKYTAILLY